MKKFFCAVVFLGICAVIFWTTIIEPGQLRQTRITPARWQQSRLKIVFFSDLHAGSPFVDKSYIQNLVRRINDLNPDVILVGGDLLINGVIGGRHIGIEAVASELQLLKSKFGTFAVLGNHDWWNEGPKVRAMLESVGISVLENEARRIVRSPTEVFWLIGIGDETTGHADVNKAFQTSKNSDDPKIVFMHDPGALFLHPESFYLAFAGHMHGGQIYLPGVGALVTPGQAPRSWAQGWVTSFAGGQVFVSNGIGTSILPIRLGAPPEYVFVDLNK